MIRCLITIIYIMSINLIPCSALAEGEGKRGDAASTYAAVDQRDARDSGTGQPDDRAKLVELQKQLKEIRQARKQYEAYITQAEKRLIDIERQRREIARLNLKLSSYLERIVDRLASFTAQDLPFLREERTRRITFLKDSLNDYEVQPSERLRRLLEALRVEAEYGQDVEKTESFIELNGKKVRVDLLRLGRLALFYRALDGRDAGWRASGDNDWRPLNRRQIQELDKALSVSERRQTAELVILPLRSK